MFVDLGGVEKRLCSEYHLFDSLTLLIETITVHCWPSTL